MISEKWDCRFIRLAKEVSIWSKDPSTKIGCVIVDNNRKLIGTGYNGFPQGISDDERLCEKHLKLPLIIHAEMNALLNCLDSGTSVKNAHMYIFGLPPCSECTKHIIQSGIKRVVYCVREKDRKVWEERSKLSLEMIIEAGLEYDEINENICNTVYI